MNGEFKRIWKEVILALNIAIPCLVAINISIKTSRPKIIISYGSDIRSPSVIRIIK
jgi:hypothetical protein